MDDKILQIAAQEYGTPFYLYDKQGMEQNYRRLQESIFPKAKLYYSMKANPTLGICQVFRKLGAGIEVASAGEMCVAQKAGFAPQNMLFTSPGKTKSEIAYALLHQVGRINIESLAEAQMVNEVAESSGMKAHIGLRVNPAVCYSNAKIKMSGVSSQFGMEESSLSEELFAELRKLSYLELDGFQVYMGTQMLLADDIIQNTQYTMELALRLSKEYDITLNYLNVGGGFGVAYFKNEVPLDLERLKKGMRDLGNRYGEAFQNTDIIFESGRFMMADTGVFVTKVLYTKESKGQKYAVCDGGSNFHSSAAFLGRFIRNNFPMHTIPAGKTLEEYTLCGPLCTSLDVIGQKVQVNAQIAAGDFVVIEKSGAYGYTYSPSHFLSHEQPCELLADGSKLYVLRNRGSIEDYLNGQNSLL